MIIKMKIHCAPKKGSFLRSLAHLHPLLKSQPLGRCPLPRPAPTLQWLLPHTKSKREWPGARRGLPSLLSLSCGLLAPLPRLLSRAQPHLPPCVSQTHLQDPPCRHLCLSTCWSAPPGLGAGVTLSWRPSLTIPGTSAPIPPLHLHQPVCSAPPARVCLCLSPQTRQGAPWGRGVYAFFPLASSYVHCCLVHGRQ